MCFFIRRSWSIAGTSKAVCCKTPPHTRGNGDLRRDAMWWTIGCGRGRSLRIFQSLPGSLHPLPRTDLSSFLLSHKSWSHSNFVQTHLNSCKPWKMGS
jgi:hypothetical protein